MFKPLYGLAMGLLVILFSCSGADSNNDERQALVYEGMPKSELLNVLGQPNRIDTTGKIFQTRTNEIQTLERWFYDKRIVVVINDSVKNPNVKGVNSGEAY